MRRIIEISFFFGILLSQGLLFAQPRIGIELAGGGGIGLNSYIDNVVILDANTPILVDELPGTGLRIRLSLLFRNIEILAALQLYNRNFVVQHHRAQETISLKNRLRTDGSVDDSGVKYTEITRKTVESRSNNSGDLFVGNFAAGYRFYLLKQSFNIYVPVALGLSFVTILEPAQPLKTGAFVEGGIGTSFAIGPAIALFGEGRFQAIATPSYARISDAARTSFRENESSESTLFSSFLSTAFLLGIQITIR